MRSNRKRGQRYEHRFNEWTCDEKKMMLFSLPLIAGNLLQQTYNIADTVIVGRFLGADALAAVGSSYTLMTFFDFDSAGGCAWGSGALFSIRYGEKNEEKIKKRISELHF